MCTGSLIFVESNLVYIYQGDHYLIFLKYKISNHFFRVKGLNKFNKTLLCDTYYHYKTIVKEKKTDVNSLYSSDVYFY
jgi:hypothetical protein